MRIIVCVAVSLTGFVHGALACDAQIASVTPSVPLTFDPFDGVTRGPTVDVELVNLSGDPCRLSVVEVEGEGHELQGRRGSLPYVLNSARTGPVTLDGGQGKRVTASMRVDVARTAMAASGDYRDSVKLRVIDLDSKKQIGQDRQTGIDVTVPKRAQLNIAGADSASSAFGVSRIDFGQMQTGAERSVFVQVRATDDVEIRFTSQNSGVLKHVRLQDAAPSVPYGVTFDGVQVNLASPFTLEREVERGGSSYLMSVKLGEVGNPPAGEYQDLITIDVTAQ
jgi:hypothetical protein